MTQWDAIRSRQDAEAARARGELDAVLLMPAELGGAADAQNVVLVPPTARSDKNASTAELLALFRAGRADQLSVVPDYRGDSFVPAAITIIAWREGETPAYERRIDIW